MALPQATHPSIRAHHAAASTSSGARYVNLTLPFQSAAQYSFGAAAAVDASLLMLGFNDDHPDTDLFRARYLALLQRIASDQRVAHAAAAAARGGAEGRPAPPPPRPPIISVVGGTGDYDHYQRDFAAYANAIENATRAYNAARGRETDGAAHVVAVDKATWIKVNHLQSPYIGCDGHMSTRGHQAIADSIEPDVRAIVGW